MPNSKLEDSQRAFCFQPLSTCVTVVKYQLVKAYFGSRMLAIKVRFFFFFSGIFAFSGQFINLTLIFRVAFLGRKSARH